MDTVCVVSRHIPGHTKAVSAVISLPMKRQITEPAAYWRWAFKQHKEEFCTKFPEFNDATWTYDVLDTVEY